MHFKIFDTTVNTLDWFLMNTTRITLPTVKMVTEKYDTLTVREAMVSEPCQITKWTFDVELPGTHGRLWAILEGYFTPADLFAAHTSGHSVYCIEALEHLGEDKFVIGIKKPEPKLLSGMLLPMRALAAAAAVKVHSGSSSELNITYTPENLRKLCSYLDTMLGGKAGAMDNMLAEHGLSLDDLGS